MRFSGFTKPCPSSSLTRYSTSTRRARLQVGELLRIVWVAHVAEPGAREKGPPVGREGAHEGHQARRPHDADDRREDVRREGGADQGRVTAVGAAVDPDPGAVGDALA